MNYCQPQESSFTKTLSATKLAHSRETKSIFSLIILNTLCFVLWMQLQEQQKQLSPLQEATIPLTRRAVEVMSQEKTQGQEVETESQNDEEDAKPLKSSFSKTHSFDTPLVESLDDKEKSGSSIRRTRTLPGRLKGSQLEPEDRTGNSLSNWYSTCRCGGILSTILWVELQIMVYCSGLIRSMVSCKWSVTATCTKQNNQLSFWLGVHVYSII